MITDSFLEELIHCNKVFDNPGPWKMKESNRSTRCDIQCSSADGKYKFTVFLRQSLEFIEDFSVGLRWMNPSSDGKSLPPCILLRCQGPHDGKEAEGSDLHHSFHMHILTEKDIVEQRYSKPSHRIPSDSFSSFESAVFYFEQNCGMIGLSKVLPNDGGHQLSIYD